MLSFTIFVNFTNLLIEAERLEFDFFFFLSSFWTYRNIWQIGGGLKHEIMEREMDA